MKHVRGAVLMTMLLSCVFVLSTSRDSAEAQPFCTEGTLVGDSCEILGPNPVPGPGTCPVSTTVFLEAGVCFRILPRPSSGVCPASADIGDVSGQCRQSVAVVPGGLRCQDGYELTGARCVRYVDPSCGPAGCRGTITLRYTVDCVGDGLSRVQLGQPVLTAGAAISFITVNGSATISAAIPAGRSIKVVVTPQRANDVVDISGPTVAPACGATAPTPTPATAAAPTATPRPLNPVPPATPLAPTPTAEPEQAEDAATAEDGSSEPSDEAPAEETTDVESTGDTEPAPQVCPPGHAFVDPQCLPPCTEAAPETLCFEVGATDQDRRPVTQVPTAGLTTAPAETGSDVPFVPLAVIAGVTVVVAPAVYVFASRHT